MFILNISHKLIVLFVFILQLFAVLRQNTLEQEFFVFSIMREAVTQTNRKSSLCLSYLEEQLVKLKLEAEKNCSQVWQ